MNFLRRSPLTKAVVLFFFFSLLINSSVEARTVSASANGFLPAIDPSGYFTVYGSQTMQPWRYHFGAFFNYARNPLEVGVGGIRRAGVIDNLIMGDFFGSIGITDWWQIGADMPVALLEDFNDLGKGSSERTIKLGDARVESKLRLLDIDRHKVGISIQPFILLPTGSGNYLVGNNQFAGGAKLIADVDIFRRVNLALNIGYMRRARAVILNTLIDNDIVQFGLGAKVRTWDWLELVGEAYGSTNMNNFFKAEEETPLEFDGGARFILPKPDGLVITAGGGAGMTFGYGSPDVRLLVGLSYPNPKRVNLPEAPPPPPEEVLAKVEKQKIIITKKIHFEFDKSTIRPISFPILDAVVDVLKQNADVKKVRVEGHCDAKGTDAYNMKLSQRRADAVMAYLTTHGITSDRIVSVGYGKSRPIDDNKTDEGRARNRRVEFIILEQEGLPETIPQTTSP